MVKILDFYVMNLSLSSIVVHKSQWLFQYGHQAKIVPCAPEKFTLHLVMSESS